MILMKNFSDPFLGTQFSGLLQEEQFHYSDSGEKGGGLVAQPLS